MGLGLGLKGWQGRIWVYPSCALEELFLSYTLLEPILLRVGFERNFPPHYGEEGVREVVSCYLTFPVTPEGRVQFEPKFTLE